MILDFAKEVDEVIRVLDLQRISSADRMAIAVVFAKVLDRGIGQERRRCLDIIARKALNAAELRAEITRPVR